MSRNPNPLYDAIISAEPRTVANASMSQINALQVWLEHKPADGMVGLALAFIELCERYGLEPQDVATVAKNLRYDEANTHPELRAVRRFMRHEL